MVVDAIENACSYLGIGSHIDTALNFLAEGNFDGIDRLSLDEGDVTIACVKYMTRPSEKCTMETHQKFADIHVCLEGVEVLGYGNRKYMSAISDYNPETDKQFFSGPVDKIRLMPGMFAFVLPDDVHCAMMADTVPAPAKKLVIKCRL